MGTGRSITAESCYPCYLSVWLSEITYMMRIRGWAQAAALLLKILQHLRLSTAVQGQLICLSVHLSICLTVNHQFGGL